METRRGQRYVHVLPTPSLWGEKEKKKDRDVKLGMNQKQLRGYGGGGGGGVRGGHSTSSGIQTIQTPASKAITIVLIAPVNA